MPVPANKPVVSPRTVASFMQAILHGLAIQRVADPDSFDPQEMLTLTLHVLGSYIGKETPASSESNSNSPSRRPSRSTQKE
jgi:hypothetical protein